MKYFNTLSGAHKYAQNSSRKHETDRYVVQMLIGEWYVNEDDDINDGEKIVAHYKSGEKL